MTTTRSKTKKTIYIVNFHFINPFIKNLQYKKHATYGDYVISIAANNSVSVTYQGDVFDNTKAALREIADQAGFAYEKA